MIKLSKYKKRLFIFLGLIYFIFFFSLTSFAQDRYEDYLISETVLLENFSNNKNGWVTGLSTDGCYSSKIENGAFEITSTCKDKRPLYSITQTIDITKDFEIEAKILYVRGENDNSVNLTWGKNDDNYRFRFGISGNGQYSIDAYNGNWINLKDWTISDSVYKTDYNKLTVRKIGTRFYFFLNEGLVHTSDFYPFFGNQIGFQDNKNTTMRVKYLKVSYLKQNPNPGFSRLSQNKEVQSIDFTGFCGSLGAGYIHSTGEIRDLWKDGFDLDLMLGYWLLPNFGLECGFNLGFTGIVEDKKVEVNVVGTYGSTSTRTTSGGCYCSFPVGVRYTFPISHDSNFLLTIGGGGNYYFEDETGMRDVTDYTSRGSSGFGYYARIAFSSLESIYSREKLGWGIQIKYINTYANVSDFYGNYGMNGEIVNKSHASDERLLIILEFCWL